ncbi:MAG: tryptophanase [Candidatus Micrarchaeota archaeon]
MCRCFTLNVDLTSFEQVPCFKIKMTEPIKACLLSPKNRLDLLKKAKYNTFGLASQDVAIDFLTDSGTGAMSQEQWSALLLGDESYAGASSYKKFEQMFQTLTGMQYILPAHQGRAAERTLFEGLASLDVLTKDSIIASNAFFDTTLGWASQFSRCENVYCEDFDKGNEVDAAFKGNLSVARLEKLTKENPGKVKLVLLTVTNNTGGGQPVSMANIREVSVFCKANKILFFLDACRFAENAFFIKTREKGYENKTIKEIVREMFSFVDGATFSAKKDARVNIGGAILFSQAHENIYLACRPSVIRNEGLFTYGGMAGRDLEAIAQGLNETTEFPYLQNRVGQIQLLHSLLKKIGVPLVNPAGGSAVYIDAKKYLSNIPEGEYRSDTLALLLYAIGGIRSVAIGNLMYAEKTTEGKILTPAKNDFVRLAVPRNVYATEHIFYVVNVFEKLNAVKDKLTHGVAVDGTLRNDHFDHFDCKMHLINEQNFEQTVLSKIS